MLLKKESIENYLEYSEKPEVLTALLEEITVDVVPHGLNGSRNPQERKVFAYDTGRTEKKYPTGSFTLKYTTKRNGICYFSIMNEGKAIKTLESPHYPLKEGRFSDECKKLRTETIKLKHFKYDVFIKRDKKTISFVYSGSVHNWEKDNCYPEDCLYSILCSVGCDYTCADTFSDFCDEYGYNNDSIKDRNLFDLCIIQTAKLKRIFIESDIECMPS